MGRKGNTIQKVVDYLSSEIEGGRIAEGARLPSRGDLARRFGIHPTTVGLAMKRIVEKYPTDVQTGKGVFLAAPRARTAFTLGVIGAFPAQLAEQGMKAEWTYEGAVFRGLMRAAEEKHCAVSLVPGASAAPLDYDRVASYGADCLFALGLPKSREMVAEFRRRRMPLILDMAGHDRAVVAGASGVCLDYEFAFRRAVTLARERGHRRVMVLTRDSLDHSVARWREAFYAQCVSAGMENVTPEMFHIVEMDELDERAPAFVAQATLRALDGPNPPTAFHYRLHPRALGGLPRVFADRGLAPGRDISVTCDAVETSAIMSPFSMFVHDTGAWMRRVVALAERLARDPMDASWEEIEPAFMDKGTLAALPAGG